MKKKPIRIPPTKPYNLDDWNQHLEDIDELFVMDVEQRSEMMDRFDEMFS